MTGGAVDTPWASPARGKVWAERGDVLWVGGSAGSAWSLIYDGDDGLAWKLNTRKDSVPVEGGSLRYEYRDQRLVVGDAAALVPNDVLSKIRDPLEKSAGLFHLARYTLHRQVVDVLARELSLGEWVPTKVLRARLGSMPRELVGSLIATLSPRYLVSRTSDDGSTFYTLTLAGLLDSERSDAAQRIISGALAALARLFGKDPRIEEYGWRDVSETDGTDLPFMWAVIEAAGLMNGGERLGQGAVFRVPKDVEDVVDCRDSTTFFAYLRSGASGRTSPSAPLCLAAPPPPAADLSGATTAPMDGVGTLGGLSASMASKKAPRVFVVHGHDLESLGMLELALRRVGAEPVILGQEPAVGAATIVEKLEKFLPGVDAVVCLLTPDDEGRRRGTKDPLAPRARENVLIEAGYAVLSRRARSILVALGGVSIPSDFAGIERVEDSRWSKDVGIAVARSLHAMGLEVDPLQAARESKRGSAAATSSTPSRRSRR